MPKLYMSIPHRLSQDEALTRIKRLLGQVKVQYSGKINDLRENWNGNQGTFSFSIMGSGVSGMLTVKIGEVALDGNLPYLALPFKGRIESIIRERAKSLLS